MNKIWFRRKLYGWGWTPATWEGWFVILVWGILIVLLASNVNYFNIISYLLILILMSGLLIFVCYKKGEKPRWQWGKTKD
jgi:hypothetical protein